jgi:hypothetical protein
MNYLNSRERAKRQQQKAYIINLIGLYSATFGICFVLISLILWNF